MLIHKGILLIDDLAETFSIGRRTVSRDLDVLDKWLSLRGARMERKQNQGIQVLCFSNSPEKLLEIINKPVDYIESLSPSVRQKLILLYLLFNNREIKIADIAHTFFISDTTVWNDLNNIEKSISNSSLFLERQKGVGIRMNGEESVIRLKFLSTLTEVFSSRTIIPYLYVLNEDSNSSLEINQFKLLIKRLKFPGSNGQIQNQITMINENLGYQFTMSGEALLYFYLQITIHRIKSSALIWNQQSFHCHNIFKSLAHSVLSNLLDQIFSGTVPEGEIQVLGLLLQVLEIGDLTTFQTNSFEEIISDQVKQLANNMINAFSKLDNRLYYLNSHLESVISLALASLILRIKHNIPYWHGEWGNSSSEGWNREQKEEILSRLIKDKYNLIVNKRDLENLLLYFHSLIITRRDIPEHKVRCLVCCFEGIGLASYLQSVLQREIKEINIVEATAVFKIRQQYIDKKGIELVLSTFPIKDLTTPVIQISLPIDKEKIKKDISNALNQIKKKESTKIYESDDIILKSIDEISFDEIMEFIQNFEMITLSDSEILLEIINKLSRHLTNSEKKSQELFISFTNRENLGPLYFEDYGLRVLHCKSSAVDKPRAGIIKFNNKNQSRIIYMIAPDPCPDHIRKMLSVITISFLENSSFRDSVLRRGINEVRKNLMDIYKDLIC